MGGASDQFFIDGHTGDVKAYRTDSDHSLRVYCLSGMIEET
jgi:hypothetical protein